MRPSIQDLADLTGVSKTTVSFVTNEVPGSNIASEMQERVGKTLRKLDCRPNTGLPVRSSSENQHSVNNGLMRLHPPPQPWKS